MNESLAQWYTKAQMVMVILISYQMYLAVSTEMLDRTLDQVERVGAWPVQVLNIGLFILVLGVCWLYLQSTRKDLAKLQKANEDERREYIESLKTLVNDAGKIIERNNIIFERIDRRLEHQGEPNKHS
jgi:Tfp pilus assembly protein PilO